MRQYSDLEIKRRADWLFEVLKDDYNPQDMASILTLVEIRLYQKAFEPIEVSKVTTAIDTKTKLIKDTLAEGWV